MGDASLVGNAKLHDYALIDLGAFPAMIPSKGSHVTGEVWNIEADYIEVLDRFEGSTYIRQRLPVNVSQRKKPLYCSAYVFRYTPPNDVAKFSDWYRYCRAN